MHITIPKIYPVACHTNNIGPGSTFVAIKGYNENGVLYIPQAIAQGAAHLVIHKDEHLPDSLKKIIDEHSLTITRVEDPRLALAQLSAQAAGYPAKKLRILGITGTKGKTTSAFLLEHVLRSAGYRTALMGTVRNSIMDTVVGSGLTTQQPDYLHQFFALCVQEKIDYVVMEVAAQALSLHRVHGIEFDGIIFTNFSQEHGEFYKNLDDYFAAKCLIFNQCKNNAPMIVNADDKNCQAILSRFVAAQSFSLQKKDADFYANLHGDVVHAINATVETKDHEQMVECPHLIGMFNVYNILGVYALAVELGIDRMVIAQALKIFQKVPGRLERHPLPNGAWGIIDYAHTPSSFESVLSTLSQLTKQLIVVFGAGGNRDTTKRPLMGGIAAQHAQLVIITSDNPRSEDPKDIIGQILVGVSQEVRSKVVVIIDRKEAIEYAYAQSHKDSIIALLGKGPDEYQQIGNVKYPFSEAGILKGLR